MQILNKMRSIVGLVGICLIPVFAGAIVSCTAAKSRTAAARTTPRIKEEAKASAVAASESMQREPRAFTRRNKKRTKTADAAATRSRNRGFLSGFRDERLSPGPYFVQDRKVPVYRFGPSQGFADDVVSKGEMLTLVNWKRGFSKVRLPNGGEAFISNHSLSGDPQGTVAAIEAMAMKEPGYSGTGRSVKAYPTRPVTPPKLPTADPLRRATQDELPLNSLLPPLE